MQQVHFSNINYYHLDDQRRIIGFKFPVTTGKLRKICDFECIINNIYNPVKENGDSTEYSTRTNRKVKEMH